MTIGVGPPLDEALGALERRALRRLPRWPELEAALRAPGAGRRVERPCFFVVGPRNATDLVDAEVLRQTRDSSLHRIEIDLDRVHVSPEIVAIDAAAASLAQTLEADKATVGRLLEWLGFRGGVCLELASLPLQMALGCLGTSALLDNTAALGEEPGFPAAYALGLARLAAAVEAANDRSPLVLVVKGAHRLCPPIAEFLNHCLKRMQPRKNQILFVLEHSSIPGTARRSSHALLDLYQRWEADGITIQMTCPPWSKEELGESLAVSFRQMAVPNSMLEVLSGVSGGYASVVNDTLRQLARTNTLAWDINLGRWNFVRATRPQELLFGERVDGRAPSTELQDDTRRFFAYASLFDPSFESDLIVDVLELDGVGRSRITDILAEVCATGVLVPESGSVFGLRNRYRFSSRVTQRAAATLWKDDDEMRRGGEAIAAAMTRTLSVRSALDIAQVLQACGDSAAAQLWSARHLENCCDLVFGAWREMIDVEHWMENQRAREIMGWIAHIVIDNRDRWSAARRLALLRVADAVGQVAGIGADNERGVCCLLMGNAHQTMGEVRPALARFELAASLMDRDQDNRGHAFAGMAATLRTLNMRAESLDAHRRAVQALDQVPNPSPVALSGISRSLKALGAEKPSLDYRRAALVVQSTLQRPSDPSALAKEWYSLGMSYHRLHAYADAAAAYSRAREIHDGGSTGNDAERGRLLHDLGCAYSALGQHDLALQELGRALELREHALGRDHVETRTTRSRLQYLRDRPQGTAESRGLSLSASASLDRVAPDGTQHMRARVQLTNDSRTTLTLERSPMFLLTAGGRGFQIVDPVTATGTFYKVHPALAAGSAHAVELTWTGPQPFTHWLFRFDVKELGIPPTFQAVSIGRASFDQPAPAAIGEVFIGLQEPLEVIPLCAGGAPWLWLAVVGNVVNTSGKPATVTGYSMKLTDATGEVFDKDLVKTLMTADFTNALFSLIYGFDLDDAFTEGTLEVTMDITLAGEPMRLARSASVKRRTPALVSPPVRGLWHWGEGPGEPRITHANAFWPARRYGYNLTVLEDVAGVRRTFRTDADTDKSENYFCFGRSIHAVQEGVVVEAVEEDSASDPNRTGQVVVQHGQRRFSVYANLRLGSLRVRTGQTIRAGEMLAEVGRGGSGAEPHLRFAVFEIDAAGRSQAVPLEFSDLALPSGTPILTVPKGGLEYFAAAPTRAEADPRFVN